MNKRASLLDVFYIAMVLFMLSIFTIIGYTIYSKANDSLQQLEIKKLDATGHLVDDTVAKGIWSSAKSRYVPIFEGVFVMILVLMWIVTMILASQIDSSPVYFFGAIFVFVALIMVGAVLGNTYYQVATSIGLDVYADDFTLIPTIMNYYAHILFFMGISVGLVMWSKRSGEVAY
jgi:hypothetical protein